MMIHLSLIQKRLCLFLYSVDLIYLYGTIFLYKIHPIYDIFITVIVPLAGLPSVWFVAYYYLRVKSLYIGAITTQMVLNRDPVVCTSVKYNMIFAIKS